MRATPLVQSLAAAGLMQARFHRPSIQFSWQAFIGAYVDWNALRNSMKEVA